MKAHLLSVQIAPRQGRFMARTSGDEDSKDDTRRQFNELTLLFSVVNYQLTAIGDRISTDCRNTKKAPRRALLLNPCTISARRPTSNRISRAEGWCPTATIQRL
jgi:hypothetical protein